jgi:hypothetical protein
MSLLLRVASRNTFRHYKARRATASGWQNSDVGRSVWGGGVGLYSGARGGEGGRGRAQSSASSAASLLIPAINWNASHSTYTAREIEGNTVGGGGPRMRGYYEVCIMCVRLCENVFHPCVFLTWVEDLISVFRMDKHLTLVIIKFILQFNYVQIA